MFKNLTTYRIGAAWAPELATIELSKLIPALVDALGGELATWERESVETGDSE